jgi:hypothetical protein
MRETTSWLVVLVSCGLLGCVGDGSLTAGEENTDGSELAASESPVRLLRGQSRTYWGYGEVPYTQFDIVVRDLDYHKKVAIHRRLPDGSWGDVAARYVGPAHDGWQLWQAQSEGHDETPWIEFVVRYEVSGRTYWDNNGGAGVNYWIKAGDRALLKGTPVLLHRARAFASGRTQVDGIVQVRDIAYEKQVRVVYTEDGWATHGSVDGVYVRGPNLQSIEEWDFVIPEVSVPDLEFAVAYTAGGRTYWDNNFGSNYRMEANPYPLGLTCGSAYTANGAAEANACWP